MKLLLQLEELAMFIVGTYLFYLQDIHFAWFFAFLLLPDIGALGYLLSNKIGAIGYNIFHHKGIAILLYAAGFFYQNSTLTIIGIVLFTHSSMDRIFGYGLKHTKGFKFTHLGNLGVK